MLLGLLADVEPELDEQRAVLGERALEGVDAPERTLQRARLALAHHALQDRRRVPGAQKQTHLSGLGQSHPITPVLRTRALGLRGFSVGLDAQIARVQPLAEYVQGLGLARAVCTVEQDDHGKLRLLDLRLNLQ